MFLFVSLGGWSGFGSDIGDVGLGLGFAFRRFRRLQVWVSHAALKPENLKI